MIEVIRPGLLTTIQDLGRPGYAHLGVPRSGALDVPSLIRANHLVGNPDGAAALETTLTGVSVRAQGATTIAVCGAPAPVTVDGQPVPFRACVPVPAGALVDVGAATTGVRSYVAFGGGITVAPVLGSRSTDTLSTLGPPPLRAGHIFPFGRATATDATSTEALIDEFSLDGEELVLRIRLGPRLDWISVLGRDALMRERFALSVKSNRVGARLTGPTLTRAVKGELPSEGIVLGAVQVPADGQPLIFLADHPTTGGYPVIGVIDTADLPRLVQARPGTAIRFESWT
jgi:biotin-dependent carboxylase-like uncharacterized protein